MDLRLNTLNKIELKSHLILLQMFEILVTVLGISKTLISR